MPSTDSSEKMSLQYFFHNSRSKKDVPTWVIAYNSFNQSASDRPPEFRLSCNTKKYVDEVVIMNDQHNELYRLYVSLHFCEGMGSFYNALDRNGFPFDSALTRKDVVAGDALSSPKYYIDIPGENSAFTGLPNYYLELALPSLEAMKEYVPSILSTLEEVEGSMRDDIKQKIFDIFTISPVSQLTV